MGINGSSLVGKGIVPECLLPYTGWSGEDVWAAFNRWLEQTQGRFALGPADLRGILQLRGTDSVFELFDTDRNSLVDAYELMGSLCLASQMKNQDRVKFIFDLYDWNGSGTLSMDEITLLVQTIVTGTAKMDKRCHEPTIEEIESLTWYTFQIADVNDSDEISRDEWSKFCMTNPKCSNYLAFWDQCLFLAPVPEGGKWTDPDFGNAAEDVYWRPHTQRPVGGLPWESIKWRRPSELFAAPVLFGSGHLRQGALADQWFLSALAILAIEPDMLKRVFVPTGQEAAGRYCIRLFKDGDWRFVYVDDRIPCGLDGKPLYATTTQEGEIWPMLLEKAYAKVHVCYQALDGGATHNALRDLTGYACGKLTWDDSADVDALWADLNGHLATGPLGVTVPLYKREHAAHKGLIANKSYGVLHLKEAHLNNGTTVRLVHLLDSWGCREWDEAWADGSKEWDEHPEAIDQVGYTTGALHNGKFWMSFDDFLVFFKVANTTRAMESADWIIERREEVWSPTTGGGNGNLPSWTKNPQFSLYVHEAGEVIITMMQPDARLLLDREWNEYPNSIGFTLLRHDWGDPISLKRDRVVEVSADDVLAFRQHRTTRDQFISMDLEAGKYIIVPSTFDADKEGTFYLSAQSRKKIELLGPREGDWSRPVAEAAPVPGVPTTSIDPSEDADLQNEEDEDPEERALLALNVMISGMMGDVEALKARRDKLREAIDG